MDRRAALKSLAGLALCPFCSSAGFSAEGVHWSYEGATGPAKWGSLDAASKVCSVGDQQSPVDIGETVPAQLPPLQISWNGKADNIVNNGHTIQLQAGGTLKAGSASYRLVQFHFHHPSEHTIAGKGAAMEVHFVHANETGRLAVIGVLMTPGGANTSFGKIAATMPRKAGPAVAADAGIDPSALLPAGRGYYSYEGPLTTPPCSQTVSWLLLTEPLAVADADIAAFAKLFPLNARPVQKLNRRFVLRSG